MLKSITKIAFRIHGLVGLVAGIFLLLIGLSGSILVFYHEIDATVNADKLNIEPNGRQPLPLDSLFKIVAQITDSSTGILYDAYYSNPNVAYEFRIYTHKEKSYSQMWLVSVNQYTGEILRNGAFDFSTSFLHWLLVFHYSFRLGGFGILLTTIFALLLFTSLITGIIIYRKKFFKSLLFRFPIKNAHGKFSISNFHRAIGVWSLVFNGIIFFTGFLMTWTSLTPEYWKEENTIPLRQHAFLPKVSIDSLLNGTKNIFPDFEVKSIYQSSEDTTELTISGDMKSTSSIYKPNSASATFNSTTGELIKTFDINKEKSFDNWWGLSYSTHIGTFGGQTTRWLYVFIGLTPGLLSISGAFLWWRRNKQKYIDRTKNGI
ncbi:MAG: PepSY domain-containing protein [Saprospiraceae bacterium]|jgi:uncharacterized iron-regulated membrane protein|nr:PepSY domain-containing protein [Saprospiraceae bacterium]